MGILLLVLVYVASVHGTFEPCTGRDAYLERCRPGASYVGPVIGGGEVPPLPELFFPRVPAHRLPEVVR